MNFTIKAVIHYGLLYMCLAFTIIGLWKLFYMTYWT